MRAAQDQPALEIVIAISNNLEVPFLPSIYLMQAFSITSGRILLNSGFKASTCLCGNDMFYFT